MDAIPAPIQSLVDLFATALADVRFGDVDAKTLARIAADVQAAAAVVSSAHAALDEARETMNERQEALLLHAQRAAAYAKVYAEGDAALTEQLDAITLPRPARRARTNGDPLILSGENAAQGADTGVAPRRPRGRPRKVTPAADSMLFTGK